MAARTLRPEQQVALREATTANRTYRDAAKTLHEKHRQIVEAELAGLLAHSDRMVRRAIDMGVPKARFRSSDEGLHTSNPYAIDQVLARTESEAQAEAVVTEAVRQDGGNQYRIDADGLFWITPPTEDVDDLAERLDLEFDTVTPYSARFRITPTGRLDAVDGVQIPGTIDRNPVVMWAYKTENETAALAWYAANTAAAA